MCSLPLTFRPQILIAAVLACLSLVCLMIGTHSCVRYPDIEYKEMIVDNACMQLVRARALVVNLAYSVLCLSTRCRCGARKVSLMQESQRLSQTSRRRCLRLRLTILHGT